MLNFLSNYSVLSSAIHRTSLWHTPTQTFVVVFAFGSFSQPQAGCSVEKDTDRVFKCLLSGSFVVRESRVLAENFAAKLQAARKEIILFTSGKRGQQSRANACFIYL